MIGKLVILSGPSGVGKDTVIDEWRLINPRVVRVIAETTRSPRPGEVHGEDYFFSTVEEFEVRIEKGAFLEHKNVFGNYYGTPLSQLEALIEAGKIAILKIDVQGALDVMKARPEAVSIFILPPSLGELERRLRSRATDSEDAILNRLEKAKWEIEESRHYQHRIVNEKIADVVAECERILQE